MKKIYTTLVVALTMLMAMPSQAQVKFGIRGGANLVNMKLNSDFVNNLNKDNRAGFYIGPTVKFTVPIVGLSMDASALYDQRSSEVTVEGTNTTESMITRQLAIPVNVRYGWGLGSVADVFLFAGPQVAFNFAKDKSIFNNAADWSWKSSNFSINVGLGCTILSHVELKANYNIACGKTGEATVWDSVTKTAVGSVKSKYNSWQLGMAYYF